MLPVKANHKLQVEDMLAGIYVLVSVQPNTQSVEVVLWWRSKLDGDADVALFRRHVSRQSLLGVKESPEAHEREVLDEHTDPLDATQVDGVEYGRAFKP